MKEINEHYRKNVAVSIFSRITPVLLALREKPSITFTELRKETKTSGGALYHRVKDAENMGLYKSNGAKVLTELGLRWLSECKHSATGMPSRETIKKACLNVPLFKLLHEQNPELIIPNKIFTFFLEHCNEEQAVDVKIMGMAVKRYLEGVHNTYISRRVKIRTEDIPMIRNINLDSYSNKKGSVEMEELEQLKKLNRKYGRKKLQRILELIS